MKDHEPQSLSEPSPGTMAISQAQKPTESRRSSLHLLLCLCGFIGILRVGSAYLDKYDSMEDKLKGGVVFLNCMILFLACILLPTPNFTGVARYFFKFVQSVAFTYVINVVFMIFMVGLQGPQHPPTHSAVNRPQAVRADN